MDLDPRRLAVLAAIARRGTLAGAAAALHVTPSAVSQQLAALEHSVGRPLVDRSGRRAVLTAAGRLLAGRAEAIARELLEAERELAALSGRAAGQVRVAASPPSRPCSPASGPSRRPSRPGQPGYTASLIGRARSVTVVSAPVSRAITSIAAVPTENGSLRLGARCSSSGPSASMPSR
ncbi:LysR family transcriptional regulator [Dactylosporangium matsuzakiense]|uniref:LysR family transcriptional regulator n=1 Tax=Dactylosporangium matsuzakiense TaxID=53360 RepID=UPI0021C29682|nr:LysR family transcriptional regulator [Dactylosporangium matsuzakiense]UWZ47201.1 LysR family transcriptional regulator [Dactylosporangium matsuzakiense]